MDVLWRMGLVSFALITLVGVGIIAALWFAWPPLTPALNVVTAQSWFNLAEGILLGVSAAGLVAMVAFAFAAPRRSKKLIVNRENGNVNISQAALRSVVKNVAESHRECTVEKVSAKVVGQKSPHMNIRVRIDPGSNIDLGELGGRLQYEITTAVEHFSGCPVREVSITFIESKAPSAQQRTTQLG